MMTPKTTINPIQLHLLEMFRYCDSEQTLDADAIEKILDEHWRTPYEEVK